MSLLVMNSVKFLFGPFFVLRDFDDQKPHISAFHLKFLSPNAACT